MSTDECIEILDEELRKVSGGRMRVYPVPEELRMTSESLASPGESLLEARIRLVREWNARNRDAVSGGLR